MLFKLAHPSKLSPPTLYSTAEEASGEGKGFWPGELFYIQEVRPGKLSDLLNITGMVSDMRERLAGMGQDESILDVETADGSKLFNDITLQEAIGRGLDAWAERMELDLSTLVIKEARYEVRPSI